MRPMSFFFVFESDKHLLDSINEFFECLKPYAILKSDGELKIEYYDKDSICKQKSFMEVKSELKNRGETRVYIDFKIYDSDATCIGATVTISKSGKKYAEPTIGLYFHTYTWFMDSGLNGKKNMENVFNFMKSVISKTNCLFASVATHYLDQPSLAYATFEYYKDPYFFCLEPELKVIWRKVGENELISHDFLFNEQILNKLNKIKMVMQKKELIKLIRTNLAGGKIICTKSGIGLFNNPFIYPRYFIRKRIRELGVQLNESMIEEEAKRKGIK